MSAASDSLCAIAFKLFDVEYAQRALCVWAQSREFRVAFDPHVEDLAPRVARLRDPADEVSTGRRLKSGQILTVGAQHNALCEAALWCIECEGIAPRPYWLREENAKLRRPGESAEKWLKRIYWNAVRNNERNSDAMHASLDAPINPDDAASESIIETIGSNDAAHNPEHLLLRQQGAKLIIELIDGESTQDVLLLTLDGWAPKDIAGELSISRPRVYQLLASGKRQALAHPELSDLLSDLAQGIPDPDANITVTNRCDIAKWNDDELDEWIERAKSNPEEYERRQALADSARSAREERRKLARLDRQYAGKIALARKEAARTMPAPLRPLASGKVAPLSLYNAYFDGVTTVPLLEVADASDAVTARKLAIAKVASRTGTNEWREALNPRAGPARGRAY